MPLSSPVFTREALQVARNQIWERNSWLIYNPDVTQSGASSESCFPVQVALELFSDGPLQGQELELVRWIVRLRACH